MSKKHKNNEEQPPEVPYTKKTYYYVALVCTVISVVFIILNFSMMEVFLVYGLIVSILMSLAALSFLSTQKKKNNFKAVKPLTVINYVLLIALVLFFVGGIIYSYSVTSA